jgi:signal peptidase I
MALYSHHNILQSLFPSRLFRVRSFASGRRRSLVQSKRLGIETNPAIVESSTLSNPWDKFRIWITPLRFRRSYYTREHVMELLRRFPLWMVVSFFCLWDQTSPYSLLTIHGPSMLPTMAADGSEVWLIRTRAWHFYGSFCQTGDLVGFAPISHSHQHISCKRVVGMAGDRVPRYGPYVHLYTKQDPHHWGQSMPPEHDGIHDWIDRSFAWDQDSSCDRDKVKELTRRIVVPPGHVWLESDCPGMGIDSRQHGPIPEEWIRGRVVRRVWPWFPEKDHRKRPHPISLDTESLRQYNVHIVQEDGNSTNHG